MNSRRSKQHLRSFINFDLPKGLIVSYYREVFNALSQGKSKIFTRHLRVSDYLERLLKKLTWSEPLHLQSIPIDPNQKGKLINANQIEGNGI